MKLPKTHRISRTENYDAGGHYVEWYADTDGGSGYGDLPLVQRWYVTESHPAPGEPPKDGWVPLSQETSLDRTDPGYWKDNF